MVDTITTNGNLPCSSTNIPPSNLHPSGKRIDLDVGILASALIDLVAARVLISERAHDPQRPLLQVADVAQFEGDAPPRFSDEDMSQSQSPKDRKLLERAVYSIALALGSNDAMHRVFDEVERRTVGSRTAGALDSRWNGAHGWVS
jgi:hypothetical protein